MCIIGTRGSKLALAQAEKVQDLIQKNDPNLKPEIKVIETKGDIDKEKPLSEMGGKGVFIKQIEEALVQKEIDIAVHSMKDITATLADGCQLSGFLQAESIADCLILNDSLKTVPQKPHIATGSSRRQVQLKRLYPEAIFSPIRGNIDTRLEKLKNYDAIVLSEVGLIRLGLTDHIHLTFDTNVMIPAPGQGVIALETRSDDAQSIAISNAISSQKQTEISQIDWAFMKAVGLGCDYPLGLKTDIKNKQVIIHLFVATKNQDKVFERTIECTKDQVAEMVQSLANATIHFLKENQ